MGCSQSKDDVVQTSHTQQPSAKSGSKAVTIENIPSHLNGKTSSKSTTENGSAKSSTAAEQRPTLARHGSKSKGDDDDDDNRSHGSTHSVGSSGGRSAGSGRFSRRTSNGNLSTAGSTNPKMLAHSTSAIGLDEMIEDRREIGDLRQNVVHIEVPFGKPIEEVYDGVHNGPVLGSGISGLVRLVTHKATGLKYAVKVLDLGLVDTTEGLKQLREEIFIMCQLDHPNIVRLEEVYESTNEIYLVQELCLGGELFDRLDEQPDYHYTEAECARLVKHMLSAVRYLHSRGIIHRDLKLENFLFSSTAKDSELKMIDFGLSKHFRYGEMQHEAVGTPYTVAPEVIRGSYDERCDIWAIGVITFLLLSGEPPFGGCGGPEPLMTVRSNILRGIFEFEPEDVWENVSQLARDFIKALLVIDPKKRPTAKDTQKHPWLLEWANRSRKGTDNVLNPNVVKALVTFKEYSDMRKLLCEVLSFTLLPDQIKDLRREFEKMDTEGSGEISLTALKQVLMTNAGAGSLGALTEEEVTDIFNAMRVRKTETRIHWHEFIAAGLSQCQVDDRNLRLAFDRLDSDHKGYITLDDILDLMGSDALQSEDAMRQMWGDSIKAVKGQHARITYGDFLLLMKGQTRDAPSPVPVTKAVLKMVDVEKQLDASLSSLVQPLRKLKAVPEGDDAGEKISLAKQGSMTIDEDKELETDLNGSDHTPLGVAAVPNTVRSAPSTPLNHKRAMNSEFESPLSMDEDDDINQSGPGVPGMAVSLTPPTSPLRGASDYVTPSGNTRTLMGFKAPSGNSLYLPGLPTPSDGSYTRRRARSVGNENDSPENQSLHMVADAVRDMLLPETDHAHTKPSQEKKKSALQVNRQLYRAHRHMRLAVLEASKRFEEQQAAHARDVILAQRETEETGNDGMIQAGLVMRHGHKRQVSSEAVHAVLLANQAQQQALVEKANRRCGRGRSSRKKTISDMSGMMTSMGQDDLGAVASTAIEQEVMNSSLPPVIYETQSMDMQSVPVLPSVSAATIPAATVSVGATAAAGVVPPLPDLTTAGNIRKPTVPGEFKKTEDPFSKDGKYGFAAWK